MNVRHLLRWIREWIRASPEDGIDIDEDEVERLVEGADHESVSRAVLTNQEGYTHRAVVTYLESGERPEYVLHAGRTWVENEDGSEATNEIPSGRTLIVITDDRILFVIGKRLTDTVFQTPYEVVEHMTVKYSDSDREAFLVVKAEHQDEPKTFIAELLFDSDMETFRSVVRYANDRAATGK